MNNTHLECCPCISVADFQQAIKITRAYVASLGIDLGFQNLDQELADFSTVYRPPDGIYLLARVNEETVGGVGLRRLEPGVCEMKRLYVYPAFSGQGLGRQIASAIIEQGKRLGYAAMRLDTLGNMAAAQQLYESLGFIDIPAYRFNPDPDTRYMELPLSPS